MKDNPNIYKCIKLPLKNIIKDSSHHEIIFDAVIRTNKIIVKTYLLLRLWVLDKYHNDKVIPEIDQDTILTCIQTINSKSYIPRKEKKLLYDELKNLYDMKQEDGSYLVQILTYKATTILTMIENNIKANFFDYVKRYVNAYFYLNFKDIFDEETLKEKIGKVKSDLINNENKSDVCFHNWINTNRNNIFPNIDSLDEEYKDKGYYYDIKVNPQRYLKHMIWMSLEIEKLDKKMFQFFPLQNNIIPKFIGIDTMSIVNLFVETDNAKYQSNLSLYTDKLWSDYFNINQKLKGYTFDNMIYTDGHSVSLRFISNNCIINKINKHVNMKKGKEQNKGLTKEEKKEKRKKLEKKKKEDKVNKIFECICGTIISEGNKSHKKSKKHIQYLKDNDLEEDCIIEFPYITEIKDKTELEGKHIFIDPGKIGLFTMLDDNDKRLTYSNKQRMKGTRRLKYNSKLKRYKDKNEITEIENILSKYNSKTCNMSNFIEYIGEKIRINELLYKKYEATIFRQYKFYSYINTKRTESKMLNIIEKEYGKDSSIIIGDWSVGKHMRNFISTPNIGLKRKLKERFKVYNIDEFRTSCLHHKTENRVKNMYVKDWYKDKIKRPYTKEQINIIEKNKKLRRLHSVLTYKMENNRLGCINRDYNGCLNIRKIFNEYMRTGERPWAYSRQNVLTPENEESNRTQAVTTVGSITQGSLL
jgi:hypothetical protein